MSVGAGPGELPTVCGFKNSNEIKAVRVSGYDVSGVHVILSDIRALVASIFEF